MVNVNAVLLGSVSSTKCVPQDERGNLPNAKRDLHHEHTHDVHSGGYVEGSMSCASPIFIQVHVDPAANFMKALG